MTTVAAAGLPLDLIASQDKQLSLLLSVSVPLLTCTQHTHVLAHRETEGRETCTSMHQ